MGVFIDGKVQGNSFPPPKKYKRTKQAFWCLRNLHEIVCNSECLDYSELSNILSYVRGECLANTTEKSKILGSLMDKEVASLDDHACPKIRDLVDGNWICASYPIRHKTTLHSVERKAKLLGNWTMQHLKFQIFCIVQCFLSIYVSVSFKMINLYFRYSLLIIERTS